MKRIILIFSIFILVLSACACRTENSKVADTTGVQNSAFDEEINQKQLTVDKVVELSAKGEELTWNDFEQYESTDVGSGLYILVYNIDENFELRIGGYPEDSPMYMRLVAKQNTDNFVEIRTEDVKAFVQANSK